jgi:hypothetical protein
MDEYKYHYLYKITNKITGEYYYGVHSTNNLEDKYFGSGVNLSKNIKKYGKNNFVKENIEYFPSRKELMIAEKNLVTMDMLKDKNCLNVIVGGGELKGSIGKKLSIRARNIPKNIPPVYIKFVLKSIILLMISIVSPSCIIII